MVAIVAMPAILRADDLDPDSLAPGVSIRIRGDGASAAVVERLATDLSWSWGEGSPDARIPADGFGLEATGLLHTPSKGGYRLLARSDGRVVVKLAGRVVLEARGEDVTWKPIDLDVGFTRLELVYQHGRGPARLAIDWEGPDFAREPLPARALYHDPAKAPAPDRFEEGRRLADRLGCANCHVILDLPRHPNLGPPLANTGRTVRADYLRAWLADPAVVRPATTMPTFARGLAGQDLADLSSFLVQVAGKGPAVSAEIRMGLNVAGTEGGRILFRSVGCLGCHPQGNSETFPAPPAAPDLIDVGRKWVGADLLAAFLEHPRKATAVSGHRPDLRLSADEASQLATFLMQGSRNRDALELGPPLSGDPDRGRRVAERLRCASCHAIPGLKPPEDHATSPGRLRQDEGCLSEGPRKENTPRFALTAEQRQALRAFVAGLPATLAASSAESRAQDVMNRLNCAGCHIRQGAGGNALATRLTAALVDDPALGGLKGRLTPPNLTAVGDKLRPEFLALAVRGEAPASRPWLVVRMPAFRFEAGEAEAIVAEFQDHDRMEPAADDPSPARPTPLDPSTNERAVRLMGQRGFGCVSCHVVAGRLPPGAEPETLGPDLALSHLRMTERYFRRWLSDPQRIIPGTPMPQFLKPIAGEPGALDEQLSSIWRLLGGGSLAEEMASGTREVLRRTGERAAVVRDMVLLPDGPDTPYNPRALVVGLKNDFTLLFDADRSSWIAWWRGGFLSRTKTGRLWEWHPEGERLWTAKSRRSPIVFLAADGSIQTPDLVRDRFGSFRELEFVRAGVRLSYDLELVGGGRASVTERIEPTEQGWTRALTVKGAPKGSRPAIVLDAPAGASHEDSGVSWNLGADRVTVRVGGAKPAGASPERIWILDDSPDGSRTARLETRVGPAARGGN